MLCNLTHGSLFSGIGGFELGAEMADIETLWNCEIEKFQSELLKQKFPNAERYSDITKTTDLRYVDIISGGFPCQDISVAYSNEIGLQSDICLNGGRNPIFKKWASDKDLGYICAKRIYEMPAHTIIRNGNGVSNWSYRVGALGNAVNPCLAKYLFECIKIFNESIIK